MDKYIKLINIKVQLKKPIPEKKTKQKMFLKHQIIQFDRNPNAIIINAIIDIALNIARFADADVLYLKLELNSM
ncbi:hypothetical protein ACR82Z_00320 [Mycoplasma sp. 6243]|uniref:hypothetical protein n=1 Tax=Mycoplasma sp. 6243 TaxID=3440865 RepID=UPI003EBA5AE5